MATLTAGFKTETEKIHREHKAMEHLLANLDIALNKLVCKGEALADLSSAEDVRRYGRQLVAEFPEHCRREQTVLLKPVSEISPQLRNFCTLMQQEHTETLARLEQFATALDELETSKELPRAIGHLKRKGSELMNELRRHVETEERELSGFL